MPTRPMTASATGKREVMITSFDLVDGLQFGINIDGNKLSFCNL